MLNYFADSNVWDALKVAAILTPVLIFVWIVLTVMALHRREVYFWSLGSTCTSLIACPLALVIMTSKFPREVIRLCRPLVTIGPHRCHTLFKIDFHPATRDGRDGCTLDDDRGLGAPNAEASLHPVRSFDAATNRCKGRRYSAEWTDTDQIR